MVVRRTYRLRNSWDFVDIQKTRSVCIVCRSSVRYRVCVCVRVWVCVNVFERAFRYYSCTLVVQAKKKVPTVYVWHVDEEAPI
jgi:hypothetical protein